jgi:outer membrane protein insertion porin family
MQLNYFNSVNPDLRPNNDGTIDLVFDIAEKDNIGQLSVGAAYSQVDKFVGNFSVSIPNFRGLGQQLDLNLEYGQRRKIISLGFQEPWIFSTPTSLSGTVYYQHYSSDWVTESYGFRIGLGRRLQWPDDYFRIGTTYQLSWEREQEQQQRYTIPDGPEIIVPESGLLSRLGVTLSRNDTDIPNFPNYGSSFYISPEITGLGGKYKYLKGTVGYDWYYPLFWKFVLGTKTKFGLIYPMFGAPEVVISRWDMFNIGGVYTDGTLRGYTDYTFGGRYHPTEGMSMLAMTTELRFPILEQQLYLGIFGDIGNTWSSLSDVDYGDLYSGVGVGMRIMVPMLGLMGFDFGWKLDDPNRSHFSNKTSERFEFHFLMNRGF